MPTHALVVEMVDPSTLTQHPDNPNSGDMDAIEESVRVNGLYQPIIVQRSSRHIIAGNHRWMVAVKHGLPEMPVIFLDVTDEEAARIMLADNRTARLGHDDESQLLDLLDTLRGTDNGYAGTGYDHTDYMALVELMEGPLELSQEEPEEEIPAGKDSDGALIYVVDPYVDDDGVVTHFVLTKPNGKRMTPADLNRVRKAFGQRLLSKDEIRDLGGDDWSRR